MNWTKEQLQVISARNRNILVSAAAGSGKTAVLVERIIARISEGKHPVNIDELLIVTFTKAAAREMRERIGAAIEKKRAEDPENIHLQKQALLLHNAKITTIDSFCLDVIRNYFHFIELDPGFRIADEAELTLLKSDVLNEVLEEEYKEGSEEFIRFVECYAGSKRDDKLEEYVLRLYEFSMSYPWPKEWLSGSANFFLGEGCIPLLLSDVKALLSGAEEINRTALRMCMAAGGAWMYEEALCSDRELIHALLGCREYEELAKVFAGLSFAVLSRKKDPAVSEESKEKIKYLRGKCKDILNDIKKYYFFQPPSFMLLDMEETRGSMEALTGLVIKFWDAFAKRKQEKNIIDFHDMEHFALNILVRRENGENFPTQAADDLSKLYAEIMIDEYQDSNFVQESILNSISRERFDNPNVFMVGDVKQSIYKFRLARPELFLEKYENYTLTESRYQRIDLHKNFRSRAIVLQCVNYFFERLMQKEFGGISYDESAALYPGAEYYELSEETGEFIPELMLVTESNVPAEKGAGEEVQEDGFFGEEEDETEYGKKELEAYAVAKRIKELTHPESGLMIQSKEGVKRASNGDIVILLRTMSGWAELFLEVLAQEGIYACAETRTGYFKTYEIKLMLNFLRILDNPRQDIPLAGVLLSVFAGLSGEDMAKIKIGSKEKRINLFESALLYRESGEDTALKEKLDIFFELFYQLREKASYLPVSDLIQEIMKCTGFDYYVLAMPLGEARKQNLAMLMKQAVSFETSSYHGLFQFVRYVERLIKYEVDYGESNAATGGEAVRIMSIHKSKGLEFPVVILSGLGKRFNQSDTRASLLLHPEYGIGPEFIDIKERTKQPTLLKRVIQQKSIIENLSEELRVLYVAMTRAKEKLIMSGYVGDADKAYAKWDNPINFYTLSKAGTFLDMIGPLLFERELQGEVLDTNSSHTSVLKVYERDRNSLVLHEMREEWVKQKSREDFFSSLYNANAEDNLRKELLGQINYRYPFEQDIGLSVKTSVSELKKQSMHMEESEWLFPDAPTLESYTVPKFLKEQEPRQGTEVGTLYHKILELLDFRKLFHVLSEHADKHKFFSDELQRMYLNKRFTEDEVRQVTKGKYVKFLETKLAQRMAEAAEKGNLFREHRFVLSIPAKELKPDYDGEETMLLQGIIDAYFEEDGELVLTDYKTDYVPSDKGEELLIKRYGLQMELYQKTLKRLTGKNVKEVIIYSFCLSKEVNL